VRSLWLGYAGLLGGPEKLGRGGLLMMGGGVLAWTVDAPLSLVGDLATYPIAAARSRQEPWATWWGAQSSQQGSLPWRTQPESDADATPTAAPSPD
jgi:hypothetical protein